MFTLARFKKNCILGQKYLVILPFNDTKFFVSPIISGKFLAQTIGRMYSVSYFLQIKIIIINLI